MKKHNFYKILVFGLLIFFINNPLYSQTPNDTLMQNLQNILDNNLSGYGMKGAALTIAFGEEDSFTLTSGYATAVSDPVDTLRKWHWASCTKTLTGYVVLKLMEEGLLNINDPVGMYLDTDTIPNVDSTITIKSLLRHTSGLSEVWSPSVPSLWNAVWSNRDSIWCPNQVLSYIPSPNPNPPSHDYANTNSYLLSFIIEEITGQDLETVFLDRIFNPLGMNNSYLSTCKSFNMSELNGVWNGTENRSTWSHNSFLSSRSGNSALISTPMDVAKFFHKYFRDLLLSPSTMDSLRVPANGSRILAGTFGGATIHSMYGYHTSILEVVLATGDTVMFYGHGGNGVNNSLSFYWPGQDITIILVQNDFSSFTLNTIALLFFDIFNELNNNLPVTNIAVNENNHPVNFRLSQNYPNPFNPETTIHYNLPSSAFVKLKVYDITGRKVQTLVNGFQQANSYAYKFNAANLAGGVYYYTLKVEDKYSKTKKMILLK